MYPREDKLRAVELFIKYDLSPQSVIDGPGYPCRGSLYNWYEECLANGSDIPDANPCAHYGEGLKRAAVDHCLEHGKCLSRTCGALGYPSKGLLAAWADELEPGRRKASGTHRGIARAAKEDAVVRLVTGADPARSIADDMGVKRATLYNWKRGLLGEEAPPKMPGRKKGMTIEELEAMRAALEADTDRLELKRAVPEGTVELLGKGQGADPRMLANREKTILVESPGPAHKLKDPLDMAGPAKSSRRYQMAAMAKPGKYADPRVRICEIFHEGRGCYGYRRIRSVLGAEGATVSEKVVRRIMAEGDLHARRPKNRRCSSYKGGISNAPGNLVNRDFHADAPSILWLADITELSIPAGKVYLSPVIDCFDGKAVARTMSTSPNAEPVSTMLGDAAATLEAGEHPVGRNDRGCRYRWPGWIERCERYGITRSMSRKGCSPDNSAMEGFFGRLKVEFFHGNDWRGWSIERFMGALDDYIDWYNEKRIKVSLGGLGPVQYGRSLGLAA